MSHLCQLRNRTHNASSSFEESFRGLVQQFKNRPEPIPVSIRELSRLSYNGFRATHSIHPYPGKLYPPIPYFFLNLRELNSGWGGKEFVFDPFCGAGTVLVEAFLAGHSCGGTDINPLACLLSDVKTTMFSPERVVSYLPMITNGCQKLPLTKPEILNSALWYSDTVFSRLSSMKACIEAISDEAIRKFYWVAFSILVNRVSFRDPSIPVPVRMKNPVFYSEADIERLFANTIDRAVACIRDFNRQALHRPAVSIAERSATDVPAFKMQPTLVITSPPYVGAQKYIRSSYLSLGWLGLRHSSEFRSLESRCIGREHYYKEDYRDIVGTGIAEVDSIIERVADVNPLRAHIAANYIIESRASFARMASSIRDGGHIVLITGDNTLLGHRFDTTKYLMKILTDELDLKCILQVTDPIRSRTLITRRRNGTRPIASETVSVLRKGGV